MAYTKPNFEVYQVFTPSATDTDAAQLPCIVAPHYKTHDGVDQIGENPYVSGTALSVTKWPGKSTNGVIQYDTAAVEFLDGILEWYAPATDNAKLMVAGGSKIQTNEVLQGTNRAAVFGTRDVAVGDYVKVTYMKGSTSTTIESEIIGCSGQDVAASYVQPTKTGMTVSGEYKGSTDTDYILTVTAYTAATEIADGSVTFTVETSDGSDGTTGVVCAIPHTSGETGTAVSIGYNGLKLAISYGTTFTSAEVNSFGVTCAKTNSGDVKTIIIADSLEDGAVSTENDVKVVFGIHKNFSLDPDGYTATASGITVNALCKSTNDIGGITKAYTVLKGVAYIDYIETIKDYVNILTKIDPTEVDEVFDDTSLNNPLGSMVYAAALAGQPVYFIATEDESAEAYDTAMEALVAASEPYSIVVHSQDSSVIRDAMTVVETLSAPGVANYKELVYSLNDSSDKTVMATTTSGENLTITAAAGVVTFSTSVLASGVAVGDIIRTMYTKDTQGNTTYKEYAITEIVDGTKVKIDDTTLSITTPSRKAEIHRNMTNAQIIDNMISQVCTTNRRAVAVYCDSYGIGKFDYAPTWIWAAAKAGQRAASEPHAPLTNVTYDASATPVYNFTSSQYDKLAARGVWIIDSDEEGHVFNRHQLTTDMSGTLVREESSTANLDNISLGMKAIFVAYHGKSNISESLLEQLRANCNTFLISKMNNAKSIQVGAQLLAYDTLTIKQDTVEKDHIIASVNYELPAPFNYGTLTQRVL